MRGDEPDYSGEHYRKVQSHLRGGNALDAHGEQIIKHLDDMLKDASLPAPQKLYRALGSLDVARMLGPERKVRKGAVLPDPGFGSSSTSYAEARKFFDVGPKTVMMTIKAPKGAKALDISQHSDKSDEKEVLIARNARYKVVKYDPKTRHLEVEMLPHGEGVTKADAVKLGADSAAEYVDDVPGEMERFFWQVPKGYRIIPSDDPDAEEFDLS